MGHTEIMVCLDYRGEWQGQWTYVVEEGNDGNEWNDNEDDDGMIYFYIQS